MEACEIKVYVYFFGYRGGLGVMLDWFYVATCLSMVEVATVELLWSVKLLTNGEAEKAEPTCNNHDVAGITMIKSGVN